MSEDSCTRCGKHATVIVDGVPLCSKCALESLEDDDGTGRDGRAGGSDPLAIVAASS